MIPLSIINPSVTPLKVQYLGTYGKLKSIS